jgi:hypothetical protein
MKKTSIKKPSTKQIDNFEPTKVAVTVATVASVSLVLFALFGAQI